jgi:hypothetical protein
MCRAGAGGLGRVGGGAAAGGGRRAALRFDQVADEGLFQRFAAPRFSTSLAGTSLSSTLPACISDMRSQRFGLVHEVGGE